jgi:type IV secretion system protein VirB6/type IV secretion system protein TrbL
MAAFSKANENVSSGSDVMSMLGGGGDSGGGGGGGGEAGTSTPLSQAAGFGGGGGDSGGSGGGGGESKSGDKSGDKGGDKSGSSSKGGESSGSKGGQGAGGQQGQGTGQGGGQGGGQTAPGSTGPGMLASAASALGKAGRVTADAGANLAKGVGTVAAAKAASMRDSAMERIADTTGGKIAAAIRAQGSSSADTSIDVPDQQTSPTFGNNSLAGADTSADPESEVAAFRDGDRNDKSA